MDLHGKALNGFKPAGFGSGVTAAGFEGAAPSALMHSLSANGYEANFFRFGLLQDRSFARGAGAQETVGRAAARRRIRACRRRKADRTPFETLRSGVFWLMYFDFVLVAATASCHRPLCAIANGFASQHSGKPAGLHRPASCRIITHNLMNGLSRPLSAGVDWLGEKCHVPDIPGRRRRHPLPDRYGSNPSISYPCRIRLLRPGANLQYFPALTSDHFGTSTPPPTTRCSIRERLRRVLRAHRQLLPPDRKLAHALVIASIAI